MTLSKKLMTELQGLPCGMKALSFGAALYIFINYRECTAIQVYVYCNKDNKLITAPGRWQSIKYNTKGAAYINTKHWGRQYLNDFFPYMSSLLLA